MIYIFLRAVFTKQSRYVINHLL